MTRFFSKFFYEQTGTKATEIHSHHCLYCDTAFPQFDDLIKHSRQNHRTIVNTAKQPSSYLKK